MTTHKVSVRFFHRLNSVAKPIWLTNLDTVVLASDGLWDNLYRDEVVELMCGRSLKEAGQDLVRAASRRMSLDSMTEPSKPDDLSLILYRPKTDRLLSI